MKTVLITGGTGLIGNHLARILKNNGYNIAVLSRSSGNENNIKTYNWNPAKGEIDPEAINSSDYIIHLAGAGIGDKRWTVRRKQEIIDSRVKSGELLYQILKNTRKLPAAFISASATGYYGSVTSEKIHTEIDQPADDFAAQVCRQWEQVAFKIRDLGIRTVILRTGIVLSPEGGALLRMLPAVRLGTGSAIGSGRQYVPWIHIEDLCNIYMKTIEDTDFGGVYNAVAPTHLTNRELMRTIASVLNKPFFFADIPSILMKILFGEMAEILLEGSRISSQKLISSGFKFKFPDPEKALNDLLKRK